MPITVAYDPAIATQGQIAYDAGRGRFLQEQDRYNEQVRQFDEYQQLRELQFEESQRQFTEGQQYRYDALAVQDQQHRDRLGLQGAQLDQQAYVASEQLAQRQRESAAYQQTRNRAIDAQLQNAAMANQRGLRADLNDIVRQRDRMRFAQGLDEWDKIQAFQFRTPEQKAQAEQQWMARHGETFDGQPPVSFPYQQENLQTQEQTLDSLRRMLGDASLPPDALRWFGEVREDGKFAPHERGNAITDLYMKLRSEQAAQERVDASNASSAEKERIKQEQAQASADAKLQESLAKERRSFAGSAIKSATEPVKFYDESNERDSYRDPTPEEARKQVEMQLELWDAVNSFRVSPNAIGTQENPAAPKSPEDIGLLEIGSFYVTPDGTLWRKTSETGGVPVGNGSPFASVGG